MVPFSTGIEFLDYLLELVVALVILYWAVKGIALLLILLGLGGGGGN